MRTLIVFLNLLLSVLFVNAQTHSCCNSTSTKTFAMLGNDNTFKRSHANPVPFHFEASTGKRIAFRTTEGNTGNGFLVMAEKPTHNYILMIHEWWGLNDYIMQEAERLQKELGNVNVLALDLYDGKVAATADLAGKYMSEVKEERVKAIINGAITYIGPQPNIATIGWCFGGGWSLQTALMGGKQTLACVMYYGMPEKDVEKLKMLNSDVLGIFAEKDAWITPQVVKDFEVNMSKAGKKVKVKNFPADHAFANPSNPKYNKEFAAQAHTEVIQYFKNHLK